MTEWKEYKLGEIAEITSSKRIFYSEYVSGGVPFYRSKEIIDLYNKRNVATELYISLERYNEIKDKFGVPQKDDILLTSVGSLGIPYKVKDEDYFYFKDGNLTWFKDININIIYPDYFVFWLTSCIGKQKLDEITIGSTQAALTISGLKTVVIELPPLPEQIRIASILSSLDDKIDLLHRENKTLEAMAETLFRQWFIEEAKEDWKEVSLTRVANFLNGLACQKFPPKNEIEKLPILKIRELSNGIGDDSDYATTDVEKEYIVHAGDVIFAWSASLMVKIWDGRDCILNQHLFKVTSEKYPKWYYYFWCKHHLDEFISIAQSHATTMGHIKRKDLENAIVLVPTSSELKTMTEQIEYLLQKIENNNKQIQTLIQQRDILLPKLMSGEVKI